VAHVVRLGRSPDRRRPVEAVRGPGLCGRAVHVQGPPRDDAYQRSDGIRVPRVRHRVHHAPAAGGPAAAAADAGRTCGRRGQMVHVLADVRGADDRRTAVGRAATADPDVLSDQDRVPGVVFRAGRGERRRVFVRHRRPPSVRPPSRRHGRLTGRVIFVWLVFVFVFSKWCTS